MNELRQLAEQVKADRKRVVESEDQWADYDTVCKWNAQVTPDAVINLLDRIDLMEEELIRAHRTLLAIRDSTHKSAVVLRGVAADSVEAASKFVRAAISEL